MMRSSLFVAMLALCLVALECTASNSDASRTASTASTAFSAKRDDSRRGFLFLNFFHFLSCGLYGCRANNGTNISEPTPITQGPGTDTDQTAGGIAQSSNTGSTSSSSSSSVPTTHTDTTQNKSNKGTTTRQTKQSETVGDENETMASETTTTTTAPATKNTTLPVNPLPGLSSAPKHVEKKDSSIGSSSLFALSALAALLLMAVAPAF